MLENALIVAAGYLIGSIPFGVVVVKLFLIDLSRIGGIERIGVRAGLRVRKV